MHATLAIVLKAIAKLYYYTQEEPKNVANDNNGKLIWVRKLSIFKSI